MIPVFRASESALVVLGTLLGNLSVGRSAFWPIVFY